MNNEIERRHPYPIALQLWTIRDAITSDADRALGQVKAAGFSSVELAPLPPNLSPDHVAELLTQHSLKVVAVHADLPTSETIDYWVKLTHACRCSRLIWHGWPRDPRFASRDGVRNLSTACNEAQKLLRTHGLEFGLHNHWWEFEPLEGEKPIRLLHETLHPDIFWQLDVYWAQTAGADPTEELAALGPRLRSVHWKDGPCVHGQPMTVLGRGKVASARILRALPPSIDGVIELDECVTDPLAAARQSRIYLEELAGRRP